MYCIVHIVHVVVLYILYILSKLVAVRIKHLLVSSLRRHSHKLALGFLWTLPYVPFPFADFALYPFNCGYNYRLSHMSSPSESSNLRVVLWISGTEGVMWKAENDG